MTPVQKEYRGERPDCRDTAAMIPAFLSDELNDRDLRKFLDHVRRCRHCYEELETNYMVDRTVKYLNEDLPADTSFDLTPLLEKELREKSEEIGHESMIRVVRSIILFLTIILIVLFLLDLTGLFRITVFLGA